MTPPASAATIPLRPESADELDADADRDELINVVGVLTNAIHELVSVVRSLDARVASLTDRQDAAGKSIAQSAVLLQRIAERVGVATEA